MTLPEPAHPQSWKIPESLARAIHALRTDRNETGEQFGALIGLSKGKVSELERGLFTPSVAVALRIEAVSNGTIDASDLSADVRAAREAITCGAAQSWGLGAPLASGLICNTCERLASDPATRGCTTVGCGLHQQEAA